MSAQAQIGMFIEAGKMLLSVWPVGNYVVMGLDTLEASTGYSLALEKLTPSQRALIGGLAAAGMVPFGRVGATFLKGGAKVVGPLAKGSGKGTSLFGFLETGVRKFVGNKGVEHFTKHADSLAKTFAKSAYNFKDYLRDANHVIYSGTWVPELSAYVQIIGGTGTAKAAFVGVDRSTGAITTFHIKTIGELARKAPSLGWQR